MIKARTKFSMNAVALEKRVRWGMRSPLQKGASMIARSAKASIKTSKKYSAPGSPPNTRGRSRSLKKSIMYAVDRDAGTAIVGPSGWITGLTGHFHEFGGTQMIPGRRNRYRVGAVGPIDIRDGYANPTYSNSQSLKGMKFYGRKHALEGVAFARLKTAKMAIRAYMKDRDIWPDAEKPRQRIYRQRAYMWPAVTKNRSNLIKIFANSVK